METPPERIVTDASAFLNSLTEQFIDSWTQTDGQELKVLTAMSFIVGMSIVYEFPEYARLLRDKILESGSPRFATLEGLIHQHPLSEVK